MTDCTFTSTFIEDSVPPSVEAVVLAQCAAQDNWKVKYISLKFLQTSKE